MTPREPAVTQQVFPSDAVIRRSLGVDIIDRSRRARSPYHLRNALGQKTEPLLAFPQAFFGALTGSDVFDNGDHLLRLSLSIAMHGGGGSGPEKVPVLTEITLF